MLIGTLSHSKSKYSLTKMPGKAVDLYSEILGKYSGILGKCFGIWCKFSGILCNTVLIQANTMIVEANSGILGKYCVIWTDFVIVGAKTDILRKY